MTFRDLVEKSFDWDNCFISNFYNDVKNKRKKMMVVDLNSNEEWVDLELNNSKKIVRYYSKVSLPKGVKFQETIGNVEDLS